METTQISNNAPTIQETVFSHAIKIEPGTYTAKSDGVVLGHIGFPVNNPSAKSVGWIWGQTKEFMMSATGGNNLYHFTMENSKLQWSSASMPNSFSMPVAKGNSWSVSAQFDQANEVNPPVLFYWVPTDLELMNTFHLIEALEPQTKAPMPTTSFGTSDVDKSEQHNIDQLMGILSEVFGDKLSPELGQRLRGAVKDLVFQEIHKPGR